MSLPLSTIGSCIVVVVGVLMVGHASAGSSTPLAPACSLGAAPVVRDVMAIKGTYKPSSFGGKLGSRPWHVCQYASGSLTVDRPTSVWIGVFPDSGRLSSAEWALGACGQVFLTAVQAKPRPCALLYQALRSGDPRGKERLLGRALGAVGEVARTRVSGNPAFFYDPSASPGSNAWVYLPARGRLVHAYCTRASNPELRAGDCAAEAVRVVVPKL